MKSILYVGATLMIGASIYGFVDYKQTKDKKEFKKMYTESPAIEPTIIDEKESVVTPAGKEEMKVTDTKNTVASNSSDGKKKTTVKTARKKKKINSEMFSRGSMEERYIEPVKTGEIKPDTKKTEIKEQ